MEEEEEKGRARVKGHKSLTVGGEHGTVAHSRAGLGNSVDVDGLKQLPKRSRRPESLATNLVAVRTAINRQAE